jgi:tetratricopeptide (TPR) repeat protein
LGENKIKAIEGAMALGISQIFLDIDEPNIQMAETWLQKAIGADQKNGQIWNLAKDYVFYAELFKRKTKNLEAKESLSRAIEIFKECGAVGWVKKYERELSTL